MRHAVRSGVAGPTEQDGQPAGTVWLGLALGSQVEDDDSVVRSIRACLTPMLGGFSIALPVAAQSTRNVTSPRLVKLRRTTLSDRPFAHR